METQTFFTSTIINSIIYDKKYKGLNNTILENPFLCASITPFTVNLAWHFI